MVSVWSAQSCFACLSQHWPWRLPHRSTLLHQTHTLHGFLSVLPLVPVALAPPWAAACSSQAAQQAAALVSTWLSPHLTTSP